MCKPLKRLSIIIMVAAASVLFQYKVSADQPAILQQQPQQQQQQQQQQRYENTSSSNTGTSKALKCSRQSIILTRQALKNELDSINNFGPIWLYDLSRDELLESQRESLANLIMGGASKWNSQLELEEKSSLELEASYFRWAHQQQQQQSDSQMPSLKILRRHPDRCLLLNGRFIYTFGLSFGPIEHNLDVVQNYNRELRLSQPSGWNYAQIKVSVNQMQYEVSVSQDVDYKLNKKCPLEITDLTFIAQPSTATSNKMSLLTYGLAINNQTAIQLDRIFADYTRPTISARLKQLLKLQLNSKTLPLAAVEGVAAASS